MLCFSPCCALQRCDVRPWRRLPMLINCFSMSARRSTFVTSGYAVWGSDQCVAHTVLWWFYDIVWFYDFLFYHCYAHRTCAELRAPAFTISRTWMWFLSCDSLLWNTAGYVPTLKLMLGRVELELKSTNYFQGLCFAIYSLRPNFMQRRHCKITHWHHLYRNFIWLTSFGTAQS